MIARNKVDRCVTGFRIGGHGREFFIKDHYWYLEHIRTVAEYTGDST